MSAVTPETVAETVANALGTKLAHYMGNTQAHAVKMAGVAIAPLVAERNELLAVLIEMFVDGPVSVALAGNPAACDALEARARAAIAKATGQ